MCGQQPLEKKVDKDVLAMELVASQSHGEIKMDTRIINNIVMEGSQRAGQAPNPE